VLKKIWRVRVDIDVPSYVPIDIIGDYVTFPNKITFFFCSLTGLAQGKLYLLSNLSALAITVTGTIDLLLMRVKIMLPIITYMLTGKYSMLKIKNILFPIRNYLLSSSNSPLPTRYLLRINRFLQLTNRYHLLLDKYFLLHFNYLLLFPGKLLKSRRYSYPSKGNLLITIRIFQVSKRNFALPERTFLQRAEIFSSSSALVCYSKEISCSSPPVFCSPPVIMCCLSAVIYSHAENICIEAAFFCDQGEII
jgi:hypothetical protein